MVTSTLTIYANRKPHTASARTPHILSDEEEARIGKKISELFPDHLPEFVLAINTGLRKKELFSLKWTDVDFANRCLFVKSRSADRLVPLNENAMAAFQTLVAKTEGFVFPDTAGDGCVGKPGPWWHLVLNAAHLEHIRWYDLRHTFASRFLSTSIDLTQLCSILGHKSMHATSHFYGVVKEATCDVVNNLDGEPR